MATPDMIEVHLIPGDEDVPPTTVTIASAQSCELFIEYLTRKLGRKPVLIHDLPLVPTVLCRSLQNGGMYVVEMAPDESKPAPPKPPAKPKVAAAPKPPAAAAPTSILRQPKPSPAAPAAAPEEIPVPVPVPVPDPSPAPTSATRRPRRLRPPVPPPAPVEVDLLEDDLPESVGSSPPVSPVRYDLSGTTLASWGTAPAENGRSFESLLEKSHAPLPVISYKHPAATLMDADRRGRFGSDTGKEGEERVAKAPLVMTDEDVERLQARKKRFGGTRSSEIAAPSTGYEATAGSGAAAPFRIPSPPRSPPPALEPTAEAGPPTIHWMGDEDGAFPKRSRVI